MKITSLKVRGIGVFAGEVEMPIAALDQAELVALVGANGTGKTTLAECVPGALYRTTPSRGAIAGLAGGRDSYVELGVDADQQYTLRLLIDGVARNRPTEAYAFGPAGEPLVSGKARDFDAWVAKTFPAPEVFLSSAFAVQGGGGSFLDLPPAARKALFAKLLGLARLEQLAEQAGNRAREAEATIAGLNAKADALEGRAADAEELRRRLAGARGDVEANRARVAELEEEEAAARAAVDAWREKGTTLDREVAGALSAHEKAQERRAAGTRVLADLQKRLAAVGARRAALEEKLGRRGELQAAVDAAADMQAEVQRLDAELVELRARAEAEAKAVADWNTRASVLRARVQAAEQAAKTYREQLRRDAQAAADKLAQTERAAKRLDGVPCGGAGDFSACALIADAARARDALADLRTAATTARERAAEDDSKERESAALREQLRALGESPAPADLRRHITEREQRARALRASIAEAQSAQAHLAALDEVARQAVEADSEAAGLRSQLADAGAEASANAHAATQAESALRAAQRVAAEHTAKRPRLADEAVLAQARRDEVASAGAAARLEQALAQAEQAAGDIEVVRAEQAAATTELDDWRHLALALGKQGVQALEIDAAGPEVSALTNELLHACYGPRFSVSLETTQLKADGKGSKETFDLRVIDSERGTEGSADQLSGGEKVLVSEALALAIAIYNTRRSSQPLLTLFRDECSGALSSGNAVRYVEMLRRAIKLGGFHRVFFVAHQPDLWALADARVLFENGACRLADAADVVIHDEEAAAAAA